MKNLELLKKYETDLGIPKIPIMTTGAFLIPMDNNKNAFVIATYDRQGWDHVSFHLVDNSGGYITRTMNNEEMQIMRNMFFYDDELVEEFHPCKKDYVNNHNYVLHLWHSTENNVIEPNRLLLPKNMSSKLVSTPNQKQFNIRFSDDENYERLNVRCVNKKKNIVKRYPTWADMCDIKRLIYGEDIACVQFRDKDLTQDYSIDIYKPKNNELACPPSILVGSKQFGKLI